MRKLLKSLLNGQGHHLFRPPSIPPHLGFLRMPYASSFSLPSVSSMEFEISIIDRACNLVQNYQWISLKTEFPSMNPSMAAFILSKLSSNHYLVLQFFLWVSDQPGFKHSVETYCTTLLVLSNGGLRSGIFVLIQRLIFNHSKSFLIEAVDFLVNHSVKPMFLDTIIVSLVRVQMFEEVVLVVGVINRHGYILPFQYCNRLVRFLKMNKGILDLNHVIFSSFTRLKKIGAGDGYTDSSGNKLDPNICKHIGLIRALCHKGKVEVALRLREKLLVVPDIGTYNHMMNCLCKLGYLAKANRLLKEIMELGLIPDCVTYTTLVDGFCRFNYIDGAFVLLNFMVMNGIKPNRIPCNILVNALCNRGQLEDANKLLAKLLTEHKASNLITMTILMNGHCREGNMLKALELWDEMLRKGILGISPNIVTYSTLINGHCREGKLVEAWIMLSKMSSNGVLPDHISYALVIRGLCLHGNVCRAHQLLHKMLDDSILPDPFVWNLVIDGYGRCGEIELVYEVTYHMLALSVAPNIFTYKALIHAHVKAGNLQGAFMLKEEMFENGILLDVVTYNLLIGGLCSFGHVYFAFQLHDEMLRRGYHPDTVTYTELIRGLCISGKTHEAHELLVKMKKMDVPLDHVP
ncbi:hypothetical protein AMTR_s00001p00269540 [Amborella trichopoda]|uniref:Pentacotripeptide-repeat region of PRORP domain-containing protein n=1 Tax=Amborella trichopoda TaxID=13333 RepID=W1NMQ8_AMBTC|nr:hypothetical protein AMTR_s00001p00269540 [Amborella trichopoda]